MKPGARLLLAEPAGHVGDDAFDQELAFAAQCGLTASPGSADLAQPVGAPHEGLSEARPAWTSVSADRRATAAANALW